MEYETEEDIYTSQVYIKWIGYEGKSHSRVVPSAWTAEYVRATRKMTPDPKTILVCEVF